MNNRNKDILQGVIEARISKYLLEMTAFLADRNYDPDQFKRQMLGFVDYYTTISPKDLTLSASVTAAVIFSKLAESVLSNAKVIDQEMLNTYVQPALALLHNAKHAPLTGDNALLYCESQSSLATALSMLGNYSSAEERILDALEKLKTIEGSVAYVVFTDILYTIHIAVCFNSRDKKPWTEFYNTLSQGNDFSLQALGSAMRELLREDAKYLFHMKVTYACLQMVLKHRSADYFPKNTLAEQLEQPFCIAQFDEWEAKLGKRISHLESLQGLLRDSPSVMFALMQRIGYLQSQVEHLQEQLGQQQDIATVSNTHAGLFSTTDDAKVIEDDKEKLILKGGRYKA